MVDGHILPLTDLSHCSRLIFVSEKIFCSNNFVTCNCFYWTLYMVVIKKISLSCLVRNSHKFIAETQTAKQEWNHCSKLTVVWFVWLLTLLEIYAELLLAYTEDVTTVFSKHRVRHHLYADDKQAYVDVPIQAIDQARSSLQDCIADVSSWCSSRRLQLNTSKTELIWFGSRRTLDMVSRSDLTLQLDSGTLHPVEVVVRDLGVLLDCELSMKQHIAWIASNCFYHLRRLR